MLGMPYLGLPNHGSRDLYGRDRQGQETAGVGDVPGGHLPRLFALVINRVELSIARSFMQSVIRHGQFPEGRRG